MKKLLAIILAVLMLLSCWGCAPSSTGGGGGDTGGGGGDVDIGETDDTFSYYPKTKLRDDKKVFLLNPGSNMDISVTMQAIQGLFSRDKVTFYLNGGTSTSGVNIDMYYIDEAKEYYGLTVEDKTFAEAVEMYKTAWSGYITSGLWGSKIALSDFNTIKGVDAYVEEGAGGYSTPGYILYRKTDMSVNVASTLAGITGFLPIERGLEADAIAMGLVKKFDVDNIALGYKWVFDTSFTEINTKGLVHQGYTQNGGKETNSFLKDVGVANKYMHVFYDSAVSASEKFKKSLHSSLDTNIPILGYTFDEGKDVAFFSQYGQFIVPTDYSYNITFFAAEDFKRDSAGKLLKLTQPNKDKTVAQAGKHYVSFLVSDGDNATMWQNTAPFATNMMNASGRNNDKFPVGWGITPSLADLMPSVMRNVYTKKATPQDYFAVPVCGQGYINPYSFISNNDGKYLSDFLSKLDVYMKKADLNLVTVMPDGGDNTTNLSIYDSYAKVPSVKGGVVYSGSKYFGNVRGGVYWANNKPFVGPRDSLWETTPAYIAARLNKYPKDYTKIDGYSLINVHPWSHSYQDIRNIVKMLDKDVVVVSPDRLYEMMSENIVDKTNPAGGFAIPELNGISITEAILKEDPSNIPVDPLCNDFLLWEEDWTKSSATGTIAHSPRDNAASNVGANFHTSLAIDANTTAKKANFDLPKEDNLWVSFLARGNSSDITKSAKFNLKMTIGAETKQVISATAKGVSGTGTAENIKGDGWQFFAFPINQYFTDYKGKNVGFELAVAEDSPIGIKLDRFEISAKTPSPNGAHDIMNNEFDKANTEDWLLGYQFLTSQYYYWGATDKDTHIADGLLHVDCSDGGGDEKRNANSNMFTAKTYTLPATGNITLKWKLGGQAWSKLSIVIDGNEMILRNWGAGDNIEASFDLSSVVANANGKVATIILQARDSGTHNGAGELITFDYFKTITA